MSLTLTQEISAASVYVTAKASVLPKSPRSVLNVYAFLASLPSTFIEDGELAKLQYEDGQLTEGTYQTQRLRLTHLETIILRTLGFQTHVAIAHTLCINYLQALDVFKDPFAGQAVARQAFLLLNASLVNPQLLYLTHQPPALATSAIYLAARQAGVKLPEVEWWEVFDTDREELGFLVVAMLSIDGFAEAEKAKWQGRKVPLTVEELEAEMNARSDEHDRNG